MDAAAWDERYRQSPLVWGAEPNRWVASVLGDVPPGRALDLACGEGRNAIWLARRGWTLTAVDFSSVAVEKGRAQAPDVTWVCADVLSYRPESPVDLALLCYLQLPDQQRRTAVRNAVDALAPGGTLFVVGHDSRNLLEGTGGPQDPTVLFTADDIAQDAGSAIEVSRAEAVLRPVEGADRPAVDALFTGRRIGASQTS
jgi:SAM-dependent methyltransferase